MFNIAVSNVSMWLIGLRDWGEKKLQIGGALELYNVVEFLCAGSGGAFGQCKILMI